MVKIGDVALEAAVSVATVSRALNNNATVDPDLAARVRDAATRLGYRPNAIARNLRRRQTKVWALIITDIGNPFYTSVARGVEDIAQKNDFSLFLCNTDEDVDKETRYIQVAEQEQVAGVILAPNSRETDVSRLLTASIPLVVVDRTLDVPVDSIRSMSKQGAIDATDHLLAQGWKRPACITGPAEAETAEERRQGYTEVVSGRGLPELVRHVPFHTDGGRHAVAELLDSPVPPDSFFIANSVLALGVLDELKSRQLVPGRDLGLITFDDAPWAPLLTPAVSVIAQPAYEIGAQAGGLLVARIRGEAAAAPTNLLLQTTLIVRESSLRT